MQQWIDPIVAFCLTSENRLAGEAKRDNWSGTIAYYCHQGIHYPADEIREKKCLDMAYCVGKNQKKHLVDVKGSMITNV